MKFLKNKINLFSYIDQDLENWNVDEGVQVSVELKSIEQTKDFKFSDVFKETDCVSQEDVISFVENNKEECQKYNHFFLLKNSKNKFFVASVYFDGGARLKLAVYEFTDVNVWRASDERRIVVPATPLNTQNQTLNHSDPLTLPEAIKIVKDAGYKIIKETVVREEI